MATRRPIVLVSGLISELPVNDDIEPAFSELPVAKLQDGTARQLLQTDAAGTGVEWTSNVDVPGTLDVTGTATFDSTSRYPLGSASAPTITFTGDTNTGIYSPGADQLAVSVSGVERLRVTPSGLICLDGDLDTGFIHPAGNELAVVTLNEERLRVSDTGRVLIGTTTARVSYLGNSPYNAAVQVESDATSGASVSRFNSATGGINLNLQKGRGTAASPVLVSGNDNLGVLAFSGWDGTRFVNGARISSSVIGTPGSLSMPGTLEFETTPSGSSTPTPRMKIDSAGTTTLLAPTGSSPLIVNIGGNEVTRVDSSGRYLVGASGVRTVGEGSQSTVGSQIYLEQPSSGLTPVTCVLNRNDSEGPRLVIGKSRGTTVGSSTIVQNADTLGSIVFAGADGTDLNTQAARITAQVDGVPGVDTMPGRLTFFTTSSASGVSPTENMRISSDGAIRLGPTGGIADSHFTFLKPSISAGTRFAIFYQNTNVSLAVNAVNQDNFNAAASAIDVGRNSTTLRSINAGGTVNASGADYAEYMTKAGDFTISKGAICGITSEGLLTLNYADAVSFVVKSTSPSYVGGDTWGTEELLGKKPGDDESEALAQWEAAFEAARQCVDRVAFAGQVPVNVLGATPGQYIVPVETADGGIEGIAKNEADLTLSEYSQAIGKVIAIEDDGRARIIVKVA